MKVAVIGCGYWGPNLIRNFVQSNKVEELICCDLDRKRLDHMKNLYPTVQVLSDYKGFWTNQTWMPWQSRLP